MLGEMISAMAVESPAQTCPRCHTVAPAEARFCMNCGATLEKPADTDEARQSQIAASAPAPLIEKMRAAKLTGERKPVTALFADVVGSTSLLEQMDPEDWTSIVNEAFDLMSQAVFRYEGTIAQLQGDAMLAFFGAPVAHEDDPERAVFAALDMIEMTADFAEQLQRTQGIEFRIRVGINTGPVVVGNVGGDLRYEYTALGDAMNVAARMQAAAEPNTIIVTDNTMRLTGDAFEAEDLGALAVKGKTEPVHAYRVIGRSVAPGRKRGLERVGLDSRMVGREAPLVALQQQFAMAGAGRGRIAFVVGEPGIGKSRLLAELRRSIEADAAGPGTEATWIEGRCVSYGRNLPYHLLIDTVRSALSIPFGEPDEVARGRLDSELASLLGADAPDAAPYLAHLLALPLRPDEQDRTKLEPDVMQGRYVAAVSRLLRGFSARGPVVLVTEDIHWADPASIDVLLQLLPLTAPQPVLFIGALRRESDSTGWRLLAQAREAFGDALTEIGLDPLTEAESRDLISNLLEVESLPVAVRDLILARAEGNPFFVEEVVRMLIEKGVIVREGRRWLATSAVGSVAIPETLHGLLLARIDQLPDEAKRSLRIAAVIGRQFPVRVLERVLGEDG